MLCILKIFLLPRIFLILLHPRIEHALGIKLSYVASLETTEGP